MSRSKFSRYENFTRRKFHAANFPTANFLTANFPWPKFPKSRICRELDHIMYIILHHYFFIGCDVTRIGHSWRTYDENHDACGLNLMTMRNRDPVAHARENIVNIHI